MKQKQLQFMFYPWYVKLGRSVRFPWDAAMGFFRVRWRAFVRRFVRREYGPLYVAFAVFAAMSVVSAFIVVFDTNSHVTSYRKMQQLFLDVNYDLEKIRRREMDVPRIFIKTLPSDFNMIESARERKELFIKFLLPLVLKVNEDLRKDRERLLGLRGKKSLSPEDNAWLEKIRDEYKTGSREVGDILVKLDEVSVSMAIGQAAEETGWGDSRFLIDGNAIFAEWTWGGEGMLPRGRKDGLKHRVKTFPTLLDSVESYANNLNKTRYYAGFRRIRAGLRKTGKPLSGATLMSAMIHYSTQRDKYIMGVKKIIRDNRLNDFDGVRLAPENAAGAEDLPAD
jgi:Bax protein